LEVELAALSISVQALQVRLDRLESEPHAKLPL
jgi:hypothetical protein